jgi:hypothetical protein
VRPGAPRRRLARREASVMTEQRTDWAEDVVPGEEAWTIEAPEDVEEDDEETAFEELIEEMVEPEETAREAKEAIPPAFLPRRITGDEFTCTSCHLIMARSCLADEERGLCHECALEVAAGSPPAHRHAMERPCPVCARMLLVPERPDSVCGYYCPGCGVHIRTRRGHRHLEWDHHEVS